MKLNSCRILKYRFFKRRLRRRRFSGDVLTSAGRTLGDDPLSELGRELVIVGEQLDVVTIDDNDVIVIDDNDVIVIYDDNVIVADASATADVVVDDVCRLEVEVEIIRSFKTSG